MTSFRADGECIVIPFRPRPQSAGLTSRDRIEVGRWRDGARQFGYDRLVIHEREYFDPPDTDSFLSIYRSGEPWSRWGIARRGPSLMAWCSATGADLGPFASISDAMMALLPAASVRSPVSAVS